MHVPTITLQDLEAFHASHFPSANRPAPLSATSHQNQAVTEDDLGLYQDGSKRTLTGEQIAIFRHTEIENLLKERRWRMDAEDDNDHTQGNTSPDIIPRAPSRDMLSLGKSIDVANSKAVEHTETKDSLREPQAALACSMAVVKEQTAATEAFEEEGEVEGQPKKKRKRPNRKQKAERAEIRAEHRAGNRTFNRIARELDEAPVANVELDY